MKTLSTVSRLVAVLGFLLISPPPLHAEMQCPAVDELQDMAPTSANRYILIEADSPNTLSPASNIPPCGDCFVFSEGSRCHVHIYTDKRKGMTTKEFAEFVPGSEFLLALPQGKPALTNYTLAGAVIRLGDRDASLPIHSVKCDGATVEKDPDGRNQAYIRLPKPKTEQALSKCALTLEVRRKPRQGYKAIEFKPKFDKITYSGAVIAMNYNYKYTLTKTGKLSGGYFDNAPINVYQSGGTLGLLGINYISRKEAAYRRKWPTVDFGKIAANGGAKIESFKIVTDAKGKNLARLGKPRIIGTGKNGKAVRGKTPFSFSLKPRKGAKIQKDTPTPFKVKFNPSKPGTYYANILIYLSNNDPALRKYVKVKVKGTKSAAQ